MQIDYLRFTPRMMHDEGDWLAICDELRMAANGRSEAQARQKLSVTIQTFCRALRRKNELERAFKESGLQTGVVDIPLTVRPEELIVPLEAYSAEAVTA